MARQILIMLLLVSSGVWAQQTKAPPNPDALAIAAFTKQVEAYAALHQKIEATLPKLPEEATPEQIDRHQRGLALQIATAREGAKRGEFFTPGMEAVVNRVLVALLAGPKGQDLRESIFDEPPVAAIGVKVNGRYPVEVPLATMPARILKELPKLPKALEYRFVGTTLVLLDVPAHVIVDFIPNALPS
jgi:hypothetical protein